MPDDQGTGVTLVKILEQQSHRRLLLSRARVGGLTADIESSFVADAYRMGIVVQTVGTYHPFRSTGLDLSVTTGGSRCRGGTPAGDARYRSERPMTSGQALLPNNESLIM